MEYDIVDGQIQITFQNDSGTQYLLWPEELIKVVEMQKAKESDGSVSALAELLSTLLEEHPEIFTCHYNSDVVM